MVSLGLSLAWAAARLTGEDRPLCWRFWEYDWTPAARGPFRADVIDDNDHRMGRTHSTTVPTRGNRRNLNACALSAP